MPVPTDPHDFSANTPALAQEVDDRFAPLYATFNKAIDDTNIADAALTKDLLASDALNAFLKLNTPADRAVAWGDVTVTCSSGGGVGSIAYGSADVTHGLGDTPVIVVLTVKNGGTLADGDVILSLAASGADTSKFVANVSAFKPAANMVNGTVKVGWLAIA